MICIDSILDQIVNLMMQKDKLVFLSSHKLFVVLTVTDHSEIINHMINIESLKVLTEFLNSTNPETV